MFDRSCADVPVWGDDIGAGASQLYPGSSLGLVIIESFSANITVVTTLRQESVERLRP